jgi:hypothetical protein
LSREARLGAGDIVEVRSKEEILRTLDARGQLDGLPFMPEMFEFCGRRFRVYKRAHKTCDTVNDYKSRWMRQAVHLDGLRCTGAAHGGCEAGCLIYWKEAWLRRCDGASSSQPAPALSPSVAADASNPLRWCTEQDLLAATVAAKSDPADPVYVCQATQVPAATTRLPWWDVRQYVEDYLSGNVGLGRMAAGFLYRGYDNIIKLGIGVGAPMRAIYDMFQRMRGGIPYPARSGPIAAGTRTPTVSANLQPGELVRVKSYHEILSTLDQTARNRGMTFDAEMVPYCGGTYRVLRRVTHIIHERTGRMQTMNNPCIILEGVVCQARYSQCRLFCPRSIYPYWREIWLERAEPPVGRGGVESAPKPVALALHS